MLESLGGLGDSLKPLSGKKLSHTKEITEKFSKYTTVPRPQVLEWSKTFVIHRESIGLNIVCKQYRGIWNR